MSTVQDNFENIATEQCKPEMPPSAKESIGGTCSVSLDVSVNLQEEIHLTKAYLQSAAMGTVTPLLKQELNYKIRVRRLSEGKLELPDIEKKINHPIVIKKLTEEDLRRRNIRRQQNMKSHSKMKRKEAERESMLMQKINILQNANNKLLRIKQDLLKEKEEILTQLHQISVEIKTFEKTSEVYCRTQTRVQVSGESCSPSPRNELSNIEV